MLKCSNCRQKKTEEEFYWRDGRKKSRQSWCKICVTELNLEKRLTSQLLVYTYLTTHPCIDCGESDTIVLEFDHRDPSLKTLSIADMMSRHTSLERIIQEIKKCEVRCANCHRRKTGGQFKWHERLTEFLDSPYC